MEKNLCELNDEQLEQIAGGAKLNKYPRPTNGLCPRCKVTRLETRYVYQHVLYCVNELPYCPRCNVAYMNGTETFTELPVVDENGELYVVW